MLSQCFSEMGKNKLKIRRGLKDYWKQNTVKNIA